MNGKKVLYLVASVAIAYRQTSLGLNIPEEDSFQHPNQSRKTENQGSEKQRAGLESPL